MEPTLPSNRSFGWTFTGIFALGAAFYPWAIAAAALTAAVTLGRQHWLTPFNRAWMKLGYCMGRIVNPLVLAVLFFGVFTPIGFLVRLFGHDAMARRWDAARPSYWAERDPPGPAEDSFINMF